MKDKPVYLKPNFVAEPLIAGWYAWSHLVSPATACFNIKNRHIPILKSFIEDPQAHIAACADPKMTGGPFIDLPAEELPHVKKLLVSMMQKQSHLMAFAAAMEKADSILQKEAGGYSLSAIYKKMPEILRGYIELVYDLKNNPSIKVKEALLYRSKFYDRSAQSLVMYLMHDDNRPFVFSTPRISQPDSIHLNIPFGHEGIDELYKMLRTPNSFDHIKSKLNIREEDEALFRTFFTEQAPEAYSPYKGDAARIRYFGHACILIETKDVSILVDPVISYGYDVELSRYTYSDLPDEIDYVLITHNHQDHVLLETMLQLRNKVRNWVVPRSSAGVLQDPSLKLMMKHTGFENVLELGDLDEISFPHGTINALPFIGEHGDLDVASKLGYLVHINNYKMLFLADSQNLEFKMYEHLNAIYGDVDVLFLGMECNGAPVSWIYGPYFHEQLQRDKDVSRSIAGCNYDMAINIVDAFKIKEAYVYAMGMEPWIKFLSANIYTPECDAIVQSDRFIQECTSRGLMTERLFGEKEILRSLSTVLSN